MDPFALSTFNLALLAKSKAVVGDFIALWDDAVIASGPNANELRERVEQMPGIDPKQVVFARIERPLATNGTPPPEEATPVTQRTYEDLASELIELEKQFPLPERGEAVADSKWFEEHWRKPALTQYGGSFVAVLNGAVVDHGDNPLQLQLDVARKYNVHPQRFIIEYIPRPAF